MEDWGRPGAPVAPVPPQTLCSCLGPSQRTPPVGVRKEGEGVGGAGGGGDGRGRRWGRRYISTMWIDQIFRWF